MPSTRGTAYEARLRTMARMNAARMAGRRTGKVILTMVRQVPAPKTREDSSRATSNDAIAGALFMSIVISHVCTPVTNSLLVFLLLLFFFIFFFFFFFFFSFFFFFFFFFFF